MIHSLDCSTCEILGRDNAECAFGYRNSIFKRSAKEIILEAVLSLKPGVKEKISAEAEEKIEYRKIRQPLEYPNIGSIFKNVPVGNFKNGLTEELKTHIKNDPFPLIPAAVLISQAGLKGRQAGGAQVSEKHANFIVNKGDAGAADVIELIGIIKDRIADKFGVNLEEEVESVGDFG
jgi:UDP-N-acetylmuramate dehydrogenase